MGAIMHIPNSDYLQDSHSAQCPGGLIYSPAEMNRVLGLDIVMLQFRESRGTLWGISIQNAECPELYNPPENQICSSHWNTLQEHLERTGGCWEERLSDGVQLKNRSNVSRKHEKGERHADAHTYTLIAALITSRREFRAAVLEKKLGKKEWKDPEGLQSAMLHDAQKMIKNRERHYDAEDCGLLN
ncbi:hypothetical protein MHYP_G00244430 [Metynnis hypsauchen]